MDTSFVQYQLETNKHISILIMHLILDFVFGVIISVMCTVIHGSLKW